MTGLPPSPPSLGGAEEAVRLSDYDYELPEERIAQVPVEPRDAARLLLVPKGGGDIGHRVFRDLPDLLRAGDLLVVNETRVSAVRLFGSRPRGGGHGGEVKVEVLLMRPAVERGPDVFEALVRPGRKVRDGDALDFGGAGLVAEAGGRTEGGGRFLHFRAPAGGGDVADLLERHGRTPLPPYVTAPLADPNRYQTVYARTPGSAAAPTAGLHFTPGLLAALEANGVGVARVRLDVGLGTFRPVRVEDVREHEMHRETFAVPPAAADAVNACRGRVVAVGTTALRALETAARSADRSRGERVRAAEGETALFIRPGFTFGAADALITNFHQPHSTLLLLVAAFVGRDQMRRAYRTALADGYRFLSFGDAMFAF